MARCDYSGAETHPAAAAAVAPAPEPARRRGGVCRESGEPKEWEDPRGAGWGAQGGARGHALRASARRTPTLALAARETPAGRGRKAACGPPPSLLNTHPEVVLRLVLLGTPIPPRPLLSPPPTGSVRSRLSEKAGEPETKKGGGRTRDGRAAAGRRGNEFRDRVTSGIG